ncbi:MAG: MFS transporter [bacterium]|nr:MFS transporter [bacterium]
MNEPQDGLPNDGSGSTSNSIKDSAGKVPVAVPVADGAPVKNRFGVHPDILKLGVVSFLTDLSSEMIFSVFAVFFTTIAGASSALLGLVEGLADFSASALNYFAGWLSDRSGRRKVFALTGYGFSTLAKIILLVSSSIAGLALFRVIERLGKGFRGPPRDAWLSAIAAQGSRGYAFGVHKALDKSGAVIGPLVAYGLLSWLGETRQGFQVLFLVAFVPAVLSILVLSRIKDQPGQRFEREKIGASWRSLSSGFKRFMLPSGVFALAYFSLGFLLLRAHETGFSVTQVVLLYAFFNVTCVIAAPLAGGLGDRIGRSHIVMGGYALYGLINLGLLFAHTQWQLIALFAVYGVFYAIDEAQGKAFITDLEPQRRATAIGVYNFVTGLVYVPASLIAGALWLRSPDLVFGLAAALSLAAILLFLLLRPAGAAGSVAP